MTLILSLASRLLPIRVARRLLFHPPADRPYRGIYRTDGEQCMKGELLVCQKKLNYHPGLNVYLQSDNNNLLLKSYVDGHVMITRERIKPDISIPENHEYIPRINDPIYKLTFNVIPLEMSCSFSLVNEI